MSVCFHDNGLSLRVKHERGQRCMCGHLAQASRAWHKKANTNAALLCLELLSREANATRMAASCAETLSSFDNDVLHTRSATDAILRSMSYSQPPAVRRDNG